MKTSSFTEFLRLFGEAFPPSMVYAGSDFPHWQHEFRAKLDSLRGPLPERVEPEVEVLDEVQEDGFRRITLRIAVTTITDLPAHLLIPDGIAAGEKYPGLIVSHGHEPYGMDSVAGVRGMETEIDRRKAYAVSAVKAGYVVLIPGWWGWSGRDNHLEICGCAPGEDKCNRIQMAASMYGVSVLSLHIQDGQAAVDVLAARPEVDAQKIGCLGNSYGGRTTMWLTAFDDRIKAAVASGCLNTFRERSMKLASCGIQYLPGQLLFGDVAEVFSLIAPRPLQLQAGREDKLLNTTDREAIAATVRRAYQELGAEDKMDYALHGEGHILIWDLAQNFLRKHIG